MGLTAVHKLSLLSLLGHVVPAMPASSADTQAYNQHPLLLVPYPGNFVFGSFPCICALWISPHQTWGSQLYTIETLDHKSL